MENHNLECLAKLPGEAVVYKAMDARGCDMYRVRLTVSQTEKLLEKQVCPKQVPLKVGAQVMLLRVCLSIVICLVPSHSHFRSIRTCRRECLSTGR